MTRFEQMLTRYIGSAFARQLALADVIGEADWQLDTRTGQLSFSNGQVFSTSVLGTQSDLSGTWLWAWANGSLAQAEDGVMDAANKLRAYGEAHSIPEFTQPEIRLGIVNGYTLAMVASGLLKAGGFYRGPYEGGAAFLLLRPGAVPTAPPSVERILTTLSQVIQYFSVPHDAMARAFLEDQGFAITEHGSTWNIQAADGRALRLEFDDRRRITGMKASS